MRLLFTLFAVCFSLISFSQRIYPRYAIGLEVNAGQGKYNTTFVYTPAIGGELDFQLHVNKWFALRPH